MSLTNFENLINSQEEKIDVSNKSLPSDVRLSPTVVLSNNLTPKESSSFLMDFDTAGWEISKILEAFDTFSDFATS